MNMKKVIEKLKQGQGVCLFPEATRSGDGKITAFKPGFGLLCRRGGAAVVPTVIDGAFEAWPRDKKIFSPGKIVVRYGEAIMPEEIKEMGDEKFAELLTRKLREMQNECRAKLGRKTYEY